MESSQQSRTVATRLPSVAEREHFSMLREAFQQRPGVQGHLSEWWQHLLLSDRRIFLAMAGLDDSEESAGRRWPQLLEQHRTEVWSEARRIARLVAPIVPGR